MATPQFKPHRDHEKIKALRANGTTETSFKCKRCRYLGWSKNGGEKKHLGSNTYCKSLDLQVQTNDQEQIVNQILHDEWPQDIEMYEEPQMAVYDEVVIPRTGKPYI